MTIMTIILRIIAIFCMLPATGYSANYHSVPKTTLYGYLLVPERCALSASCQDEYNRALRDAKLQVMIILYKEGFEYYNLTLEFFSWKELKSLLDFYQAYRSGDKLESPILAERRELQNRMNLLGARSDHSLNYEVANEVFSQVTMVPMVILLLPFILSLPFDVGSPKIIEVCRPKTVFRGYPIGCVIQKLELDFPWHRTIVGVGLLLGVIAMKFQERQQSDEKESCRLKIDITKKNLHGLNNSIATSKEFLIELSNMLQRQLLGLETEELLKLENDVRKLDCGPFHEIWSIIGLSRRERFRYAE